MQNKGKYNENKHMELLQRQTLGVLLNLLLTSCLNSRIKKIFFDFLLKIEWPPL